ncbi:MAG TPA: 2,4'-dihydroxyacetophenone dioxygenase family protein [Mycobacteriales bacterium]|nr:2,4'-dihydroxyacetophenone dioxygenase family protein [Mycobacteriales bacterium]
MTIADVVPTAIHRDDEALPFAPIAPGVESKVAHIDISEGLWVVRSRLQPGYRAQTHRHTGPVFGFTLSGAWHYLESADDVNRAGSYLYEPAGSVHTLHVPDDATEPADVWFAIWGANLNLDAAGNVETVTDAAAMLAAYRWSCKKNGLGDPPVIVAG